MTVEKWGTAQYFKIEEFTCKCGCGFNAINYRIVEALDYVRFYSGKPIIIASGCRCAAYNKKSGGKSNSAHVKGLAVDMKVDDSVERFKLLQEMLDLGFKRIGIGKNFIHIDIDDSKVQEVAWLY